MARSRIAIVAALACAFTVAAESAHAATLTAIDDTILLENGANFAHDANFGGRVEIILGYNGGVGNDPRHGLLRFDVSSIAAQINASADITSATLTLTERMARDALNGTLSRTLNVYGVVTANEGWVEGTANGTLQAGTASLSYRNTGATVATSTDWASGGATPTATDLFTFGTDTGASLGSGTVTFATGSQQTLVITITDLAGLKTLLAQWLAADTNAAGTNAGLAIQAAGAGQLFFDSIETNDPSYTQTPAYLDITFAAVIPTPAAMPAGLAILGLIAARRRRIA